MMSMTASLLAAAIFTCAFFEQVIRGTILSTVHESTCAVLSVAAVTIPDTSNGSLSQSTTGANAK